MNPPVYVVPVRGIGIYSGYGTHILGHINRRIIPKTEHACITEAGLFFAVFCVVPPLFDQLLHVCGEFRIER